MWLSWELLVWSSIKYLKVVFAKVSWFQNISASCLTLRLWKWNSNSVLEIDTQSIHLSVWCNCNISLYNRIYCSDSCNKTGDFATNRFNWSILIYSVSILLKIPVELDRCIFTFKAFEDMHLSQIISIFSWEQYHCINLLKHVMYNCLKHMFFSYCLEHHKM